MVYNSFPNSSLAFSNLPVYKSQIPANSTPGTFSAVLKSLWPCMPYPITPIRIVSFDEIFLLYINIRSSALAVAAKEERGEAAAKKLVTPICCRNFLLEFKLSFFINIIFLINIAC